MFASERLNIIKSYLNEHKRLNVHTVSELLNVSEVTIRRDLEKLEEEGFLRRMHGGAVPAGSIDQDAPETLSEEVLRFREEYEEIANVAALMIQDGDLVGLLSGGINQHIARKLSGHRNLMVVTNDFGVAREISTQGANKAVLLGGTLQSDEQELYGSLTLSNLANYFVNRLFVEVDGMSDSLHLSVRSQEKADLIRAAIDHADEVIGVIPAANFGKNAFFRLGSAAMIHKFITSPQAQDEFKAKLFGTGMQVFTSVHSFERGG